jgi:hypothetical protein
LLLKQPKLISFHSVDNPSVHHCLPLRNVLFVHLGVVHTTYFKWSFFLISEWIELKNLIICVKCFFFIVFFYYWHHLSSKKSGGKTFVSKINLLHVSTFIWSACKYTSKLIFHFNIEWSGIRFTKLPFTDFV